MTGHMRGDARKRTVPHLPEPKPLGDVISMESRREAEPGESVTCPWCGGIWWRTSVVIDAKTEKVTAYAAPLQCVGCTEGGEQSRLQETTLRSQISAETRQLAEGIKAGTTDFMAGFNRAGEGISTRMSGESAALVVQVRAELEGWVRDLATRIAEGGDPK